MLKLKVFGPFISPEPEIQALFVTNSFNRYAYVWNNPVKFTDPKEFFVVFVFQVQQGNHECSDGYEW
ncbi:hypothetical protein RND59_04540 [Vibrio ruber]|uniref:hypothetical protein n=1 Tax=Vibrio ruber TaxID=184755 RepID=UPI002892D1E4|nr:hypothetical protein [Vibrio ruber]WNJ96371.1 hypothetical protein RND59_04540 [Vibrio ruber]